MSCLILFHLSVKYCEHKTISASRSAQFQSHYTPFSTVTALASLTTFATLLLCFTSVNIFAKKTKVLVTRISANCILFHRGSFKLNLYLRDHLDLQGQAILKRLQTSRELLAQRHDVTSHMISFFHQHRYETLKPCKCVVTGNNGLSVEFQMYFFGCEVTPSFCQCTNIILLITAIYVSSLLLLLLLLLFENVLPYPCCLQSINPRFNPILVLAPTSVPLHSPGCPTYIPSLTRGHFNFPIQSHC